MIRSFTTRFLVACHPLSIVRLSIPIGDRLTSNPNTANPFTPGPTADALPAGDVERQAVASLRGYAYQVAAAALAWLDLDDKGKVYLEVAEDYATVAQQSLDAVQVKDTAESGSITLNTEAVRDAIDAFVNLVANNEDRQVQLRYFTTSPIGTEQRIADRPAGEAGLNYWRRAAAGADIGPLRAILISDKFSANVRAFVAARNDQALRHDLLHRIHWECGKPDISGIVRELEERLVILGRERFGLAATEAKQLSNTVLYQVLKISILKNPAERVLTRAELYRKIDEATQVSVSRRAVGSILNIGSVLAAVLSSGEAAALSTAETNWLIPKSDFATPRAVISRQTLASKIDETRAKYGQAVLVGASGLGKSLLARSVARRLPNGFATIDLRDVEEGEAARRLSLTLGRIGSLDFDCLIFDDFNQIEDSRARNSFGRCVQALYRRDRTAIITAYRSPSQKALTELGLDANAVIDIPYLTEEEAREVVQAAGGEPKHWGGIAFATGAQGHPQLVHAFVMGMSARNWPRSEVREIVIRGFASDDIDAERDAARRSMVASLSEDARTLLYRLSLAIGRFDRALGLKIAEVPHPLSRPGELLDSLIGPWIETLGTGVLRVSPLAAHAGWGMLTHETQVVIHAAIAHQLLRKRTVSATEANGILMHGLMGNDNNALSHLAYSVLMSDGEATNHWRDQLFMLPLLRTDESIFPTNPLVSILLRLAQFKLVATGNDAKETTACSAALLREVEEIKIDELRDMLEGMALASILNTIGIASAVSNWVNLLQRYRKKIDTSATLRELKKTTEAALLEDHRKFFSTTFSIGSSNLQSVQRVEEIFLDLDSLSAADRFVWFDGFENHPTDYSLIINPSWVAEAKRGELNATNAAERFKRMALLAEKWKITKLASECHVARAVMLDEYSNDQPSALAALDEAEATIGTNVVISRARARIYWRDHKYHEALGILRNIADVVGQGNPVDRAFAMREASISAAKTGEWKQAAIWFEEADQAAASAGTDDMHVMAIGLAADRAVALLEVGSTEEALRAMASCLARLSKVDPAESLRAGYCHRVVRHAVLWMDSRIDNRETFIDGKPIQILPGTCSNPEPQESILSLPLTSLDLAWYMLAEAEVSYGDDADIEKSLRSRLCDGPVPLMETTLRQRKITRDIINSDVANFSHNLLPFIAGVEFLRRQRQGGHEVFDVVSPPRGEIPRLSDTELAEPTAVAIATDALAALGMASLFRGNPDPAQDLQRNLTRTVGDLFPGKTLVERWREAGAPPTGLDEIVIEGIAQLRSGEFLTPRQVWEIGLRFFEKIRQSGFRNALAPLLRNWLQKQWEDIISNGSFRLSRPMQTVPAIEASFAQNFKDEAFIASLLLTTAEAVGSPLAAAYEAHLKEIARSGR